MATIDKLNTTLTVTRGVGHPTVTPDAWPPVGFDFNSPTIDANASMRLTGTAGESVAGWSLGFIQLKYIGTDYSRYRGATDRNGSILITGSNQIVCRDTDIGSNEVWYDSLNSGGTTGPNGTNNLAAGTVIPRTGFLDVPAHLFDQPDRWWRSVEKNKALPAVRTTSFITRTLALRSVQCSLRGSQQQVLHAQALLLERSLGANVHGRRLRQGRGGTDCSCATQHSESGSLRQSHGPSFSGQGVRLVAPRE